MKKQLIYLATPYSHDSHQVRENRFRLVNSVASLLSTRYHVLSPISMMHPIVEAGCADSRYGGQDNRGWDYWKEFDERLIGICDKLVIVARRGWQTSIGVKAETRIAKNIPIPVYLFRVTAVEEVRCCLSGPGIRSRMFRVSEEC